MSVTDEPVLLNWFPVGAKPTDSPSLPALDRAHQPLFREDDERPDAWQLDVNGCREWFVDPQAT